MIRTPGRLTRQTTKRARTTTKLAKKTNRNKTGNDFQSVSRTFNLGPLGFPKMLKAVHRYRENIRLTTPVSTTYIIHSFSCNGMYDPNISGVGHQPLYFDQLAAVYNHYTVIGSKITITMVTPGPTDGGARCYLNVNDDSTLSGYVKEYSSTEMTAVNANSTPTTLSNSWSAVKSFGPNPLANDNLQGTTTTNPPEIQNYALYIEFGTSITGFNMDIQVTIDYIAVWDELKDITES